MPLMRSLLQVIIIIDYGFSCIYAEFKNIKIHRMHIIYEDIKDIYIFI